MEKHALEGRNSSSATLEELEVPRLITGNTLQTSRSTTKPASTRALELSRIFGMNWTGGGLANTWRVSRSGKGVGLTEQQKKHFAKVRSTTAAPKRPPPRASVVDSFQAKWDHRSGLSPEHHAAAFTPHRPSPSVQDESPAKEDYYSATPLPQRMKRIKLNKEGNQSRETIGKEDVADPTEKRHNMLSKDDWGLGLKVLQPPRHLYKRPAQDKTIGRRRRPLDGHRARFEQRWQPNTESARMITYASHHKTHRGDVTPTTYMQSDMRISIGSIQPTNSAKFSPEASIHRRDQRAPSEIMMLDTFERTNANKKSLSSNVSATYWDGLPPSISNHSSDAFTGFESWESPRSRGQPDTGRDSRRAMEIADTADTSESYRSWDTPLGPSIKHDGSLQHSHPSPKKFQTSRSNHKSRISHSETKDCPKKVNTSPPAGIHHPRPERNAARKFLSRNNQFNSGSEIDSTAAELGQAKPVVNSSQELENEIWNTWLIPSDDEESREYKSDIAGEVSISPGASAARFYSPTDELQRKPGGTFQERETLESGASLEDTCSIQCETDIATPESTSGSSCLQNKTGAANAGTATSNSHIISPSQPRAQPQSHLDLTSFTYVPGITRSEQSNLSSSTSSNSRLEGSLMSNNAKQAVVSLEPLASIPRKLLEKRRKGSPSYPEQDHDSLLVETSLKAQKLTKSTLSEGVKGLRSSKMRGSQLSENLSESRRNALLCRLQERRAQPEQSSDSWTQDMIGSQNSGDASPFSESLRVQASDENHAEIPTPQARTLFSRPKPFVGREVSSQEPLYIGRKLAVANLRRQKVRERDIHDILGSLVESIEDD
ncbi:hypothetical protein BP5796_11089 [Coleophoma crateriformis]|uniref:Uncharacterized protein n=1 Tax=Coleophoma crateriformis TaxID=565419 RepID=A0A3D8QLZ1_9HELO|nr:hypothetical protein BP5796_11089 [Coleophoma crateriformis]